MKIWEVHKIASENPNAEFRKSGNTEIVHYFKDGKGQFRTLDGYTGDSLSLTNIFEDWELIPTEVTWQTAIFAWLDGKEIYIELLGTRYTQRSSFRFGCFATGLTRDCFKIGKWYIKE